MKNVVRGQKITTQKKARAKDLRKTQTRAEKIIWRELRGNQLNGLHFRRQ